MLMPLQQHAHVHMYIYMYSHLYIHAHCRCASVSTTAIGSFGPEARRHSSPQPGHVAGPSKKNLSNCGPVVLAAAVLPWLRTDQHRIHIAQRHRHGPLLICLCFGNIDSASAQRRLVCIQVAYRQAQRGLVWRFDQQEMLDKTTLRSSLPWRVLRRHST